MLAGELHTRANQKQVNTLISISIHPNLFLIPLSADIGRSIPADFSPCNSSFLQVGVLKTFFFSIRTTEDVVEVKEEEAEEEEEVEAGSWT